MKNIKHFYIVLFFLFANINLSIAQKGRLKYADRMFNNKSYAYASEAYEDVIARNSDSSSVASKIAYCYNKTGNYDKALAWYRYIQRTGKLTKEEHLKLALLERHTENYEESKALIESYKKQYGSTGIPSDLIHKSIEEIKENIGDFKINDIEINSEASEIGVNYIDDNKIMFASSRRRNRSPMRIHGWTNQHFYDIYTAQIDEDGAIKNVEIMKSEARTKYHDGPAVLHKESGVVYFTRSNYIDGSRITNEENIVLLKILKGRLVNNEIVEVEELSINSDEYITAHPSISKDGTTLFFSSNRPGGYGGMDIYYVELDKNGNINGEPVNMGNRVNSSLNEVFPYFNSTENLLFFSSNGHYGLGGLDVYVSKLNHEKEVMELKNLGAPINTPYDDFSYISNDDQTAGFLSSNRPGSIGSDNIYSFTQGKPIINEINTTYYITGVIKDKESKDFLEDVKITIIDRYTNEVFTELTSEENGKFTTDVLPYHYDEQIDYQINLEKDGYLKVVSNINLSLQDEQSITLHMDMTEIVVNETDLNDIIDLAPIHYDLNSSYITKSAAKELDKVVQLLKENPNISIRLQAHTDSRGEDKYNMWLSKRRAKSAEKYIISKGISKKRISSIGFGETKLIYSDEEIESESSEDKKEELHQKNRRTEFIITNVE